MLSEWASSKPVRVLKDCGKREERIEGATHKCGIERPQNDVWQSEHAEVPGAFSGWISELLDRDEIG